MLGSYFFSFNFSKFCKSGFYIDFFLKKLSEVFVRNVFIYSAQFFGEKYIVEIFSKKIFNIIIFTFNKFIGISELNYVDFFLQFLITIFIFIIIFNFFYLFF